MNRMARTLAATLIAPLVGCGEPEKTTGPVELAAVGRKTTPLGAPSGATAVALSELAIAVYWFDNSTSESGFEVHQSTAGGPFVLVGATSANVQTYSATGLAHSTSYCYRVRAVQVAPKTRYSPFSGTACATTSPLPRPEQAYYTWAVELPDGGVEVSWVDRSSNEAGFRIERADYGQSWEVAGIVGADVTTFTTDQPVCYQVIAFNAGGEASPSNPVCTAPAGPSNVTLTVLGDGTREVTWSDNSTIEDTYELWVGSGSRCCPGGGGCDAGYYENPLDFLPANTTSYRTGLDSDECETFTLILMASRRGVQSGAAYVGVP